MKHIKKKQKLNKIDKILIVMCILLLVYTGIAIYLFYRYQMEMSTLTVSFFSAFGVEGVMCAWIKNTNTKAEAKAEPEERSAEADECEGDNQQRSQLGDTDCE